jgi:hypothetical protein
VPVVFVIAVLAVLVGVFFAATGRGGELAYEQTDHAPLDLGPVSAPDIALLRPPTALWGYNMQVTDEALDHIARAVRDRDITIAYLQEELGNREPRDLNAPFGSVPPTPPDAFYPLAGRDDSPRADADPYPLADPDASRQAGADGYALADPDASWYSGAHALSDADPGSTVPSDAGPADAGPADAGPADAGPAPVTPDAPPPPRSLKPPGILVASPPREAPQPQEVPEAHEYIQSVEATQPYDVAERHEATRPSETLPGTDDTLGPQGPFDTHDWWAEQEEAAREDVHRQAEAQHAGLTPSGEPHAPQPPADAPSGSAAEDNEPPDEAADQPSAPSGPTGTVPNPVLSPPSETGTSPGGAAQPSTGPAKPLTPRDDGHSIAEEQAW